MRSQLLNYRGDENEEIEFDENLRKNFQVLVEEKSDKVENQDKDENN